MTTSRKLFHVGQILFSGPKNYANVLSLQEPLCKSLPPLPSEVLFAGRVLKWNDYIDKQLFFSVQCIMRKLEEEKMHNSIFTNIALKPVYRAHSLWKEIWASWNEKSFETLVNPICSSLPKNIITFEDYCKALYYFHFYDV